MDVDVVVVVDAVTTTAALVIRIEKKLKRGNRPFNFTPPFPHHSLEATSHNVCVPFIVLAEKRKPV